jgi:hypothetical protein
MDAAWEVIRSKFYGGSGRSAIAKCEQPWERLGMEVQWLMRPPLSREES